MLGADTLRSRDRFTRSPVPLMIVGLGAAVLLILAASYSAQRVAPDPQVATTLSQREAVTVVAEHMRSGKAAKQVLSNGEAAFVDGVWRISTGAAVFHFNPRNGVVVAENRFAAELQYGDGSESGGTAQAK